MFGWCVSNECLDGVLVMNVWMVYWLCVLAHFVEEISFKTSSTAT